MEKKNFFPYTLFLTFFIRIQRPDSYYLIGKSVLDYLHPRRFSETYITRSSHFCQSFSAIFSKKMWSDVKSCKFFMELSHFLFL